MGITRIRSGRNAWGSPLVCNTILFERLEPRLLLSVVSDEFNSPALNSNLWQFVDPQGNSSLTMTGTAAQITVPAGSDHDLWPGENFAPRLLQTADNSDFTTEMKFDTAPAGKYALQGLVVQSDAQNFLRFDVHSTGSSGLTLYAASFTNNTPKVLLSKTIAATAQSYLRVERSGDQWNLSYSSDGVTWTNALAFSRTMTVSAIGPFAGNAGSSTPSTAPGFVARIDYFRTSTVLPPTDVTPPALQTIVAALGATTIDVTWKTDEAATGKVEYGLTNTYELGSLTDAASPGLSHKVSLTGLQSGMLYHFRVISADAAGNTAYSTDQTATTTQVPTGQVQADDFNGPGLNTALWRFVNPVGDCSVTQTGGVLQIAVPAGKDHDSWGNELLAPSLMQTVSNTDLRFGAKFNTLPAGQYTLEGLAVQGTNNQSIRVDLQSYGAGGIHVFAAVTNAGQSSTVINKTVALTAPTYLALERTGDTWTVSYSLDGTKWTVAGTFTKAMTVTDVGVSAGNAGTGSGGNAPAFTTNVDSFLAFQSSPSADTTPPVQSNIQVTTGNNTIDLSWTTDELAIGAVDYGKTAQLELGRISESGTTKNHSIRLSGLQPGTTYQFRILSTDAAKNVAQSNVLTATTANSSAGSPIVDIWYGDTQSFGQPGNPQNWVNILGNVSDSHGMASLSYSLNGQAFSPLTIGPDQRRLVDKGDFNVEIDRNLLRNGSNELVLKAVDSQGATTLRTVIVNYTTGLVCPTTYTADWGSVARIGQAGQIVDGQWQIMGNTVRTTQIGYDRTLAIGDMTWGSYEFYVPVTIYGYDPASFVYPSNGAGLGMIMHWQGHTAYNNAQPRYGWTPAGATMWYGWNKDGTSTESLESVTSSSASANRTLKIGTTYIWKGRVENISGGNTIYSMKIWQQGTAEPTTWDFSGQGSMKMANGSILLSAHNTDAGFGPVVVTPLA